MNRIMRFLDYDERVILVAKKHELMLIMGLILVPFLIFAIIFILDIFIVLSDNSFYTSIEDIYYIVGSLIIITLFCIMMIGYCNDKLIFTNKRVIIKRGYSRKLILIPYKNIITAQLLHRNFPANLYGIKVHTKGGGNVHTRCNFNNRSLNEIRDIFAYNGVGFTKYVSSENNGFRPNQEMNYEYIRQTHLGSFFPAFIVIIPPLLSLILVVSAITGVNSKFGVQSDIRVTGTIIKSPDSFENSGEYQITIKDDLKDSEYIFTVDQNIYEIAENGMKVTMNAKMGCLRVLYDISYDINIDTDIDDNEHDIDTDIDYDVIEWV